MGSLIVLALNSGSSSLKFGLYRVDPTGAEKLFGESVSSAGHPDGMTRVASVLAASRMPPPDAIGHRIVHGGPALRQHGRIDAAVLRQLKAAAAFAPLPAAAGPGALSRKCGFATFLDPLGGRPAAAGPGALINDGASHCQVLVLGSREDEQIARHARTFLR